MAPKQATMKRPASSSMKRPASNNGQGKKLRVESESHPQGWTMTRFELDPFVRELLTVSNVAVEKSRQSHKDLRVAGGCDGSGLPHYVLQKILALSDAKVVSVCSAENVRGPALFLLKNFQFQHLFKDIAFSAASEGPCWVHNKCCKIGASEVDIYISGFVCKRNSCQNSQRFQDTHDPIDPATSEVQTFVESVNFVQRQKPRFYCLENVLGALRVRKASVGPQSEDTPKEWYDNYIREKLPEYSHGDIVVDALPGPEARCRLFLLGSRDENFTATDWVRETTFFSKKCENMPRHHVAGTFTFADQTLGKGFIPHKGEEQCLQSDADYHACFAAACKKLGRIHERFVAYLVFCLIHHAICRHIL